MAKYVSLSNLITFKNKVMALLNGKANTSHSHLISNITNLQTTLDGKANIIDGEIPTASYRRLTGFSILQDTDLNTIKYTGQYGVMGTCTNRPDTETYGIMEVLMYSSHWLIQRYYSMNSSGVIRGVYYRTYYADSTWSEWKSGVLY